MASEPAVATDRWESASVGAWCERWGIPELHVFERVGSTNDVLRDRAERGAPSGTVVLAEEQTAGRGRNGKHWHAPPGTALLLSILLRPGADLAQTPAPGTAPLRIGLAAARALDRVTGIRIGIKWPNDLVLEGTRKLGGILCEAALGAPGAAYIVAGIGVNVSQRADAWPPDVQQTATSLLLATGRSPARAELAGAIIREVLDRARALTMPLPDAVLHELAARDVLRGRRITVDGEPRGTATAIAPDGALVLRSDRLEMHLRSGTVRLADPAEPT